MKDVFCLIKKYSIFIDLFIYIYIYIYIDVAL